jgi:threonine dehydrogenase-like Zn-dependent dehydrogenase
MVMPKMKVAVSWVPSRRAGSIRPLVTHRFKLDRIEEAYDLFAHRRVGVPKVVITS